MSLTSASVRTPTPLSPITLEIDRPDPQRWNAQIEVPAGMTAELRVPAAFSSSVQVDGALRHSSDGRSIVEIAAGKTRIQARV